MGSEQRENGVGLSRAEVDTSAPFESVMEAVTRFGGIGFWKPPSPPAQIDTKKVSDAATLEADTHDDTLTEERETLEILKEIKATETRYGESEVKVKVNAHQPNGQNNDSNTTNAPANEVELSKTEILKRVQEATEEVKNCTRVLEEALTQVNASRQKSTEFNVEPTMSIGQILSRKLVLAKENSGKSSIRWKVSLPHVLRKSSNGKRSEHVGEKGVPSKRMKFGFCV